MKDLIFFVAIFMSIPAGFSFNRRERGWPIPPEAPITATAVLLELEVERDLNHLYKVI